jgi:hypothetical protein
MLESMIPNSVQRFSEKIMLKQEARAYSPAAGARDVCLSLNSGEKADIQLLRLRATKRTSMLIRLAGRQAAVATTLSLKATLAIQPRLADGNVADGRGIDPRGVFIKDDQVGRFACHDYTGEILAALPSRIGRHHP